MKTITATEVKNKWGQVLLSAIREPVVVEKNSRPVVVVLSIEEHMRLMELEDRYWALQAMEAERDGYMSPEESLSALKEPVETTE
ncbi:MAG: type II toxin-antitoxin system Phd/YefM family antitoxin [Acidobacteria bacterium]|nr:MAG: type II toxin-antitoxin system Phd/YefM family antitoxin [Acidobacteriota bacterium]